MDLFELFDRDAPERDRHADRQPRKGLRGLFDRLTAALDGDNGGRRNDRERRRRDETDLGFD